MRFEKLNVIRFAETEKQADKLRRLGFTEVRESKAEAAKPVASKKAVRT